MRNVKKIGSMPTFVYETLKLNTGYEIIIGCDEVGRGCLAGPVVAAAVVLNPAQAANLNDWYGELNDSKKLSPGKRFMLSKLIKEHAIGWAVGVVPALDIDRLNIHVASLLAMERAINALQKKFSHGTKNKKSFVFVDGKFSVSNIALPQEAIIKGDEKIRSISAASIIAKVHRDTFMDRLHGKLPYYGFASHKGYATQQHRAAIEKFGLSAEHRKSFCSKYIQKTA